MDKKVLVIIVTYNGTEWVEKCFGSLRESSIPLSVMAIDNASMDDTVDRIKADYPEVHLVESKENLGFGKANNVGIREAISGNADYIFLLNQDAWIQPDTVEELIKIHEKNLNFGVLSPIHLDGTGKRLDQGFLMYLKHTEYILSDLMLNNVKEIYETEFVNAAAWLVSRECFLKVGGFDPLFPHYGEDNDYAKRVIYNNLKVGIVPSAKVCHDRDQNQIEKKKYDLKRVYIKDLLEVKGIQGNYPYFFLFFCRRKIHGIGNFLYLRQIKLAKVHFLSFFKIIKQYLEIQRAITLSRKERAFLGNEKEEKKSKTCPDKILHQS